MNARPARGPGPVRRIRLWAGARRGERAPGPPHPTPDTIRAEIFAQPRFQNGIDAFASESRRPRADVSDDAERYLAEMVTSFNRFAIDVTTEMSRLYHRRGYAGRIHVDPAQIEALRAVCAEHPVVFLPSHRSYMDSTILGVVLKDNGFPPNYRLGGINMALGPVGAIGRRGGIIYIRRNFRDNELYKWVLREYLGYLAEKRHSLEWNIEGTRSRTGKMGKPKLGLLAYVADAYTQGRCTDYQLIPVSIVYDELIDVEQFSSYAAGKAKSAESLRWLFTYVARQRRRYGEGDIHVRFGTPVSLRDRLGPPAPTGALASDRPLDVHKLAFEVAVQINKATPITPSALVALVLLAVDRALTLPELRLALDYLAEDVRRRGAPLVAPGLLTTDDGVEQALAPLLRQDAATRFVDGATAVYAIAPSQRIAASYYRNTILHHFLDQAIASTALVTAVTLGEATPSTVIGEALRMRDLLKFEFFFADKDVFVAEISGALARYDARWDELPGRGPTAVAGALRGWSPLVAAVVLRPFLDAYLVVALALERKGSEPAEDRAGLRGECLTYGKQLLLQRRIRSADSVSATLFDNAIDLAAHRGLLSGEPAALAAGRAELRAEIGRAISAVAQIEQTAIAQFDAQGRRILPVSSAG